MKKYLPFLIFLIPFAFNPWGYENPSELTKFVFLIVFISGLLVYAIFKGLSADSFEFRFNKWIYFFGGFWLISLILSNIFSIAPIQSFWGSYERLSGLLLYLLLAILFLFFVNFFDKEKNRQQFIDLLVYLGGIIAIYGIIQFFIMDKSLFMSPGQAFSGRIYSFLSNPSDLGEFLLFPLTACLVIGTDKLKKKKSAPMVIASFVLQMIALFLSGNRASILAFGLVALVFIVAKLKKRFIAIFAILLVVLGSIIFMFSKFDLRSMNSRFILWKSTVELAPSLPFFGTGEESFYTSIQPVLDQNIYKFEKLQATPEAPHNLFFSILVEQGYLGILIAVFIIGFISYLLIKRRKTVKWNWAFTWAVLAFYTTLISMQFSFFSITGLVFFTAILAILSNGLFKFKKIQVPLNLAAKFFAVIVVTVAAAFLLNTGTRLIVADVLYGSAFADAFDDTKKSFAEFQRRLNLAPQYKALYSPVFILFADQIDSSNIEFFNSININFGKVTGFDVDYYIQQGVISYAQHDFETAKNYFQQAENKAPFMYRLYQKWTQVAYENGDNEAALYASDKAIAFAPDTWKLAEAGENISPEENEKLRIFEKSNPLFFTVLDINRELKGF